MGCPGVKRNFAGGAPQDAFSGGVSSGECGRAGELAFRAQAG
jgi:hypothetical protein